METTLHHSPSSSPSLIPQLIPSIYPLKPSHLSFKPSNLSLHCSASTTVTSCSASDNRRQITSVDSQFRYDTAVPEQKIDEPVGLSVAEKEIGGEPRCGDCQAKGAVICATCGGSGLYVDSIMECQGIIVKVRCLGCGGTGNIMCSECGGRGHL